MGFENLPKKLQLLVEVHALVPFVCPWLSPSAGRAPVGSASGRCVFTPSCPFAGSGWDDGWSCSAANHTAFPAAVKKERADPEGSALKWTGSGSNRRPRPFQGRALTS